MFPRPDIKIINEIVGFLDEYGEVDIKSQYVFREYKTDRWFISYGTINNKHSLLVVFNKECLVALNYPVYIPQANTFLISETVWVDSSNWITVLQQEFMEYAYKKTIEMDNLTNSF